MAAEKKKEIQEKLARSRQELLETVSGWNEAQWATTLYSEGQVWSAVDVLRHLADAEWSMTRLMQRIQQGEEGVPEDFDLDRWNAGRVRKAQDKTPAELFAIMAQNRTHLLAFIDQLTAEDWAKAGRHGSMRIMSIEAILHQIADHEQFHCRHLQEVVQN